MTSSPNPEPYQRLFAWGAVALALASIFLPFGLSYPATHDPRTEARPAAWEYLSDHRQVAYILLIIALTLLIFGLFTLHHYLLNLRIASKDSVLIGTALSLVGIALILPSVSVQGFALPDYAQTYVMTDQAALNWFNLATFGSDTGFFTSLAGLPLVLGSILLMRGVLECRRLPRWTASAYTVGMILVTLIGTLTPTSTRGYGVFAQSIRILGGILISIAGLVWAWRMRRVRYPASDASSQLT
jgi:hypothetical protein